MKSTRQLRLSSMPSIRSIMRESMQRNSFLYGVATFNFNGGKFTSGEYFKFGSTGWSANAVAGSVNFIFNNKEIAENEGTFAGVFNGLLALAAAPINGIISLINAAIEGINWLIAGINKIPGVRIGNIGKIPMLADGGTVWSGSAIVGEAGPELLTVSGGKAVVQPLAPNTGKIEGLLGSISDQLGFGNYDIPFVVQVNLDGKVVGESAVQYIRRSDRGNGK